MEYSGTQFFLNTSFETKIYYSKQTNDSSVHKSTLLGKGKSKKKLCWLHFLIFQKFLILTQMVYFEKIHFLNDSKVGLFTKNFY